MADGSSAPLRLVTLGRPLGVDALARVARGFAPVALDPAARGAVAASAAQLDRLVLERRRIYGVTTGFGPLACQQINPSQAERLQRNLIAHLATGVGEPFEPSTARAILLARLTALARGHSGARVATLELLQACLNRGVTPIVPCKGTVGASGDLTPLAHVALVLVGQGEAWFEGERMAGAAALARAGLEPLTLGRKEGLALVNGTSAMTGVAALVAVDVGRLIALTLALGLLHAEVAGGHRDAWHPRLGRARPHPGQQAAHAALWSLSADAPRLVETGALPPRIDEESLDQDGIASARPLPQDPYSIRCLPQILGAAIDVARFHRQVVERELASATDNPLLFGEDDEDGEAVAHGGNFYGQHVAFASDALHPVIVKLAALAERIVARVTDPTMNGGLPAFLQPRALGLNSGFMGAQVTASALVAELRARGGPASAMSIPTNANNQDVVSLGTIAARGTASAIEDAFRVVSITSMVLAQAAELRAAEGAVFSASSRRLVGFVRSLVPALGEDRPLSAEIERLAAALRDAPEAVLPGLDALSR